MVKPNLKTKNLKNKFLKVAKDYTKEISKHKGVIGITLGGGTSRGHPDKSN